MKGLTPGMEKIGSMIANRAKMPKVHTPAMKKPKMAMKSPGFKKRRLKIFGPKMTKGMGGMI
jgi:hypothetical protein